MDVGSLAAELVRIRSENPPGDTRDAINYIVEFLEGIGIGAEVVCRSGNRCNLVACGKGHRLLLCGHVDVVPSLEEGWASPPYAGEIRDGYVWGRGSSDMKGGCAALLWALKSIVESGTRPKVNIAFVCDEETGGHAGMGFLLAKRMLPVTDCLIAEPTPPLNPSIGQKGLARIELDFTGIPGHASLHPHAGKSAIMEALRFLESLEELHAGEFATPEELHPLIDASARALESIFPIEGIRKILTSVTYNPGVIRGGEKANVIAQHCTLELDLRIPWGASVQELMGWLEAHARGARIAVRDLSEPNHTPPDAGVVQALCREIQRVTGVAPQPIVQWAASDAKLLRMEGFPVVEYGPGEIRLLHAVDERVRIASLETASEIFGGFIAGYSASP